MPKFHLNSFFVGANVRKSTNAGIADYIPIFLSEIPALFRKGILPVDAALVHVLQAQGVFTHLDPLEDRRLRLGHHLARLARG